MTSDLKTSLSPTVGGLHVRVPLYSILQPRGGGGWVGYAKEYSRIVIEFTVLILFHG